MANIDFNPRHIGDREQRKFGANASATDSTIVFVQVGGVDSAISYIVNVDSSGYLKTQPGKDIDTIESIASGSVVFGYEPTNDNLTTEKDTGASTLTLHTSSHIHSDSLYLLSVERSATTPLDPGDLTIYSYNVVDVGSGERNVLHTTHTISSVMIKTNRDFLIQGLFVGQRETNLGFKYAADIAGTATIYYKIFKL